MPLVYIILVNYNGLEDTIECVNSLKNIKYENYKIIVVDNASTSSNLQELKNKLENCYIIESKENLGFSGGNNLGIRFALENHADYIMLLNNDTIVEPSFLKYMMHSFNNNDVGMVGGKILYYPQKEIIWYGGGKLDWFRFIGENCGRKEEDKGQYDKEKEIDFVTGCCILVRREVFEKTGLLAEEYFMYFEDVDFCVRVKDSGYKIWYNPKALIYHKVGLSSGGEESNFSIEWMNRNRMIFMHKFKFKVSVMKFIFSQCYFYVTRYIRFLQYMLNGNKQKACSIIKGLRNGRNYINKID